MKYATGIVLYVIFSAGAAFAGALGLGGLVVGQARYAGNIMHSMDMLLAAVLGWSGRRTVSKECGEQLIYEPRPCRFCRWVCKVLDIVLEPGHCRKEGAK